jgi:hypothetical protein
MVRARANILWGKDFPVVGPRPHWCLPALRLAGGVINRLPQTLQEQRYIWTGRAEAVAPTKLACMQAAWVAARYPTRQYPAVAIGSSHGAAVPLWVALGIPWLPQTLLMPVVRSGTSPDAPQAAINWADAPARVFLQANPDVPLHHMHDPNQDRLMIQRMTYFRVKRLALGAAYENISKFMSERP